MQDLSLNEKLVEILVAHGVAVTLDDEFIHTDLPAKVKFKARAHYTDIRDFISSQLDVMAVTGNGENIIESVGDFGNDIESATRNNLLNFSMGSLHPLLAAFGSKDKQTLDQITIEDWQIGGQVWTAYIGNLVPKTNSKNSLTPPAHFFQAIETGIRAQTLSNNLHWFRGYYLQDKHKIINSEFLMDNNDITSYNPLFASIPVIADVRYYSCRNFIVLRRKL